MSNRPPACPLPAVEPSPRFRVPRSGVRLDRLVADASRCGRRQARAWIRAGAVLVDGRSLAPAAMPPRDALVEIRREAAPPGVAQAAAARLVWRSGDMVALAKPAGMHSERGRSPLCAAAFLAGRFEGIERAGLRAEECGLVHRLDRDTSGILLAALARPAYLRLRALFAEGQVQKHYLALVSGRVRRAITIDRALSRRSSRVVAARRGDKILHAWTYMEPIVAAQAWSLVRVVTRTGVTHQVRVHLALAGHVILGDSKYGGVPAPAQTRSGQLLHALRLKLPGGPDLSAAVPADFLRAYAMLGCLGTAAAGDAPPPRLSSCSDHQP